MLLHSAESFAYTLLLMWSICPVTRDEVQRRPSWHEHVSEFKYFEHSFYVPSVA